MWNNFFLLLNKLFTWKRFFFGIIACLLLVLLIFIAINMVVYHSARESLFANLNDIPQKQGALVLGARVYPSGQLSAILEDRVRAGLELYQADKVDKILVSGDHGTMEYDEVNAMKDYLLAQGIPAEDIFLDHAGFDTYDSIFRARDVFQAQSVVIVSQEYHLSRALYIAQNLELDAVGFSADSREYGIRHRRQAAIREPLARIKAFWDITFHVQPTYLGKPIPLSGDGRMSWDE